MKIVFAGTPANAARTLEWLLQNHHEVVAVLTRPDAPIGRKRVLTPSPVAAVAEAAGLPIFKSNTVTQDLAVQLAQTGAQLGVVVAYGALLKPFALEALPMGWVNLHYSLLPDWRGASPVQSAILHGETQTGVSLFQLDAGMDTGPIFASVPTAIQPGENAGRLLERLTELGLTLLSQELPKLYAGIAKGYPQSTAVNAIAKVAHKLARANAAINWANSAFAIERQVLALNPEPIAFTTINGESLRVLDAKEENGLATLPGSLEGEIALGTISFVDKKVLVQCGGNSVLQLTQVQPSGKNPMTALDWVRGAGSKVHQFDLEAKI